MEKLGNNRKWLLILIHFIGWIGFFIFNIIFSPEYHENKPLDIFPRLLSTIEIALVFYLNYFYLIPRFFAKKKFTFYIISILILAFLFVIVGDAIFWLRHIQPHPNTGTHGHHGPPPFHPFMGLSIYFTILIVSSAIRMTQEWLKNERQKKELENDKLKAELASLKSQINPHFIFNVLNNICSLARKKSDKTEEVIIKLSQLLRYNLYNFEDDKVFINDDIRYINDYIDIQKMRLQDNVKITFTVNGNTEGFRIEPLLFMPFIENAFKHGISSLSEYSIDILLEVTDRLVHFNIKNPLFNASRQQEKSEGKGLANASRRLELLYPAQHNLKIISETPDYIVDLTIRFYD